MDTKNSSLAGYVWCGYCGYPPRNKHTQRPHPHKAHTMHNHTPKTGPWNCNGNTNPAFINPQTATPHQIEQALTICQHCTTQKQCAQQALTSGTTLDESNTNPATGVIQAGILCNGRASAELLAKIAQTTPPTYRNHTPRKKPPTHCKNCHKPMHKWTRNKHDIPHGYVMHHAQGYCNQCKRAYKDHAQINTRPGLRKTQEDIKFNQRSKKPTAPKNP